MAHEMTISEKQALIGQPIPRPAVRRLIRGRGRYVGDINLPRMLHLAFVRSPHAHARIGAIDVKAARDAPGVVLVASGADIAAHCKPFIADGIAQNRPSIEALLQYVHEHGLTSRRVKLEELFAPSTMRDIPLGDGQQI